MLNTTTSLFQKKIRKKDFEESRPTALIRLKRINGAHILTFRLIPHL